MYLRFCTEDYYPFDAKNLKKYVVGDDYTPPREVSLKLDNNLSKIPYYLI